MSNGEDVLDNWEEIDEAGLTNTLQKIQAERSKASTTNKTSVSGEHFFLENSSTNISDNKIEFNQTRGPFKEEQPMKLLQRSTSNSSGSFGDPISESLDNTVVPDLPKSPLDDMSSSFQPVMMLLNKPSDEYQSANYTQPMHAVKILRRPTQNVERRNNDQKPKAPIKTLKQREQEYAEARLRILGSAKNPEDDKTINPNASNQIPSTGTSTTGTIVVSNTATTPTVKKPATVNHISSAAQTSVVITPTPVRMKASMNSGQKMKPLSAETINIKNHFYPQQQMLQQSNFFTHQQQTPYIPTLTPHPILQFSNALNNSRLTIPVVSGQTTYQIQQSKNHSPALVHSNNSNTNHRNHNHWQKQPNHQITQINSKPGSWSPSRNTMRGQQQDNVLRMPRGPDGSVGFQMRR